MSILLLESSESGVSLANSAEDTIRIKSLFRCSYVKEEVSKDEIH